MKPRKLIRVLGFSVLVGVLVGGPAVATAQQQSQPGTPATSQAPTVMMGQRMMEMRQQLMAEQQARLARLQQLIDQMNATTGNAKVDAIAAVVTELVRQHKAAQERMMMPMMMMPMMGTMPGMMGTAPAPPPKKP